MNVIYKWLIGLVAVLALFGFIYAKGHSEAKARAELQATRQELSELYYKISKEREARVADARLAEEAAVRADALRTKITNLQEYVDALADAGRECLSSADTERLRDIWN
ncbi:hypothetical protein CQ059_05380 [Brucella pseudogrignonensis]|nr:hypothetical protein CQ059_05380 [Brucella pseudogrignonensis]PRA43111.1 hypothetical protein CQ063_01865 [Brucella pseudogrignonensis]PRA72419.1 hypothetical protein CQ055_03715 [Brucella pseudogrignonensis]